MPEVGSTWVTVLPDMRRFNAGVNSGANQAGQTSGKTFSSGFAKAAAVGLAVFGAARIFSGFISDAQESAKVTRLTENAIRATGGAANVTAQQVGELATRLSNATAVDDELIQSGANLLLTFKNVRNEVGKGNDIFDQATAAAVDLSAAGFGSVESASIQLGKALNDPIAGITALSRSGITFTEQQKDQIRVLTESGDLLGAQSIILEEIQGQVGGAAAAASDPIEKLKTTMGNLGETVGGFLLPAVEDFAAFAGETLIPGVESLFASFKSGESAGEGFVGFMSDLGAAARTTFDYVKFEVIPTLVNVTEFVKRNSTALLAAAAAVTALFVVTKAHTLFLAVQAVGGLAAYIAKIGIVQALTKTWTAVQWLLNAALTANPIGIVIALLVALGAGLYVAWQKSETFRRIVTDAWNAIKDAATSAWTWIDTRVFVPFKAGMDAVGAKFTATKDWIGQTWEGIKSAASAAWNWINVNVFGPFKTGISAIGDAFTAVKNFISDVWDDIEGIILGAVNGVIDIINFFLGGIEDIAGVFGIELDIRIDPVEGFASGGIYPGYTPGRDIGYVGVSGGEAIMRPEWTRAVETYNPGYIDAANKAAREGGIGGVNRFLGNFAEGGIPGQMLDILLGYLPGTRLTSGYRPGDPGYHGRGLAGDFAGPTSGDAQFMLAINQVIAEGYGAGAAELIHTPGINLLDGAPYTYSSATQADHYDHVHWAVDSSEGLQLGGGVGSVFEGVTSFVTQGLAAAAQLIADPLIASIEELTGGHGTVVELMGQGATFLIQSVVDALTEKEKTSAGSFDQPVSGDFANNQAVVQADAAKYGWSTGTQWADLTQLIQHESGFNNTAQNPTSTAYGMYQFLDSTWAPYGPKTSDPALQALYGNKYIADRYGSATGAWDFWERNNWYDEGGRVYEGTVAINHKGGVERMLTERQNIAFERLVETLDGRSGGSLPSVVVRVFVGNREITDITRTEIALDKVRTAVDNRRNRR